MKRSSLTGMSPVCFSPMPFILQSPYLVAPHFFCSLCSLHPAHVFLALEFEHAGVFRARCSRKRKQKDALIARRAR